MNISRRIARLGLALVATGAIALGAGVSSASASNGAERSSDSSHVAHEEHGNPRPDAVGGHDEDGHSNGVGHEDHGNGHGYGHGDETTDVSESADSDDESNPDDSDGDVTVVGSVSSVDAGADPAATNEPGALELATIASERPVVDERIAASGAQSNVVVEDALGGVDGVEIGRAHV